MTDLNLDAIEARANAATRGSWSAFHWDDEPSFDRGWAVTSDAGDDWVADYLRAEDVAFIAHAHTDVPALVAALREARADCETHHTTVVHQCCEDAQAVPSLRAALATVTAERDEARADAEAAKAALAASEQWDMRVERDDWRRRYEALRDGVTVQHRKSLVQDYCNHEDRDACEAWEVESGVWLCGPVIGEVCEVCRDEDGGAAPWPCATAAVVARVEGETGPDGETIGLPDPAHGDLDESVPVARVEEL